MPSLPETLRRLKRPRFIVALACLGLTGYFAHHALNGRHGLETRRHLVGRLPVVEAQVKVLSETRKRLQREIALLSTEPPSRDLVEETARQVLGYVLPSDIVWIGR